MMKISEVKFSVFLQNLFSVGFNVTDLLESAETGDSFQN